MTTPTRALTTVHLVLLGLAVAVLSATGLAALLAMRDSLRESFAVAKQAAFLAVGAGACIAAAAVHYRRFGRMAYGFFTVVLVLLALLVVARFVPLGPLFPARRNAYRWVDLGFVTFQPSELMKLAYILALARYLQYRRNYRTLRGLAGPFVLTLLPMVLILLEPDLGTVILLVPVLLVMLFAAGARLSHLALVMLAGLACAPLLWHFVMTDYQKRRIAILFRQNTPDPRWQQNEGYQLRHSKTAVGSGGVWGLAWRCGLDDVPYVRTTVLPDRHNDFIFAVIAHQWGLAGGVLVLLCYALIALVGTDIAVATREPFGRLLAVGVVAVLTTQAAVNIAMTIGLMPVTGLTLPFVSYGGSSLLTCFLAIGLLAGVARHRPIELAPAPFEFDRRREPPPRYEPFHRNRPPATAAPSATPGSSTPSPGSRSLPSTGRPR